MKPREWWVWIEKGGRMVISAARASNYKQMQRDGWEFVRVIEIKEPESPTI